MADPNALLEFCTTFAAAIVGFALLITPLFVYFRNQNRPGFSFLRRQLLLSISAIGMIFVAIVLISATIPDFWSDTNRFDTKQENAAH